MIWVKKLLKWYSRSGRKLPWRETTDPYEVLISEIMLQQTQVGRVIPFYERWLKRFPDWKSLAKASVSEVILNWSGLGYNRRALVLQDIARQVVKNGVPETEAEWLSLKGIGPYTAAALTVFTLGRRAVPIDTNIRRVAGRLLLGLPFPSMGDDPRLKIELAGALKSTTRFSDLVQGMFDLASLICLKKNLCEVCPIREECLAAPAFTNGKVVVPAKTVSKPRERRHRNKVFPDRIYRGRILRLIGKSGKGHPAREIGPQIDPEYVETADLDWVKAMLDRMVQDGLMEKTGSRYRLPRG